MVETKLGYSTQKSVDTGHCETQGCDTVTRDTRLGMMARTEMEDDTPSFATCSGISLHVAGFRYM